MTKNDDLLTRAVEKVIPRDLAEEKLKTSKPIRVYWGVDPTGAHLHLGHSVPLRKMRQFVDAGHEVILVIGSFTAMIGDPSDKEALRKMLTKEDVKKNFEDYKNQAEKILDFSKITVRYNHEWLEKLSFKDVVDIASNFTVQKMLERDTFERRIKKGSAVYLHEFMYPLMVGYDSVELDVDCELGGSDQEFNMLAGRTLQKAFGKRDKFVMTLKLIEGTDGRLMSKTYDNCIYITDEPNEMYGKIMSSKDEVMERYFECCTDVAMGEIKKILSGSPRDAKARLAREIVALYHGEKAAKKAEEAFTNVFQKGELPEDMLEAKLKEGSLIVDVMVEQNLASSKSEARRLIEQGGVKLDDEVVKSANAEAKKCVLRVGKRKFLRLI